MNAYFTETRARSTELLFLRFRSQVPAFASAAGAASTVEPKFTSVSEPSSQWTAARKGPVFFSYSTNYLIDTDHSVIVDVEGTRSIRQAEVDAGRTMLDRIIKRHDIDPERLIAPSRDIAAQCNTLFFHRMGVSQSFVNRAAFLEG